MYSSFLLCLLLSEQALYNIVTVSFARTKLVFFVCFDVYLEVYCHLIYFAPVKRRGNGQETEVIIFNTMRL